MSENKHGLTPYEAQLTKAVMEACKSFDWNAEEIIANAIDFFTAYGYDEELQRIIIRLFRFVCNEHNKKVPASATNTSENNTQHKIIIHQNVE